MKTKKLLVGTVGIDTAQLYIGEPCYVIDAPLGQMSWEDFMNTLQPEDAQWWTVRGRLGTHEFPAGMVVKTGDGDGEYPVEVTLTRDGRVASVTITFIDLPALARTARHDGAAQRMLPVPLPQQRRLATPAPVARVGCDRRDLAQDRRGHHSLVPLDEADIGYDDRQLDMFANECDGVCGL